MAEEQPSSAAPAGHPGGSKKKEVKPENTFLNLGFNLVLPILLLSKGKEWFGAHLEPFFPKPSVGVLLIALAFPVGYFVYDYIRRRKYNLFSIIGLISVLLTGGIGVLEIPTRWFAVKEAAIPLLLGVAVIVSLKTPYPLIRTLLYNPEVIDVDKVHQGLQSRGCEAAFEKLLVKCTWLLAASFLLSAVLNFILARRIVTSPSGSDAFNAEVSRMMAWSWPVIVVPSMAIMFVVLYLLFSGIHKMTGLKMEEILHGAKDLK
jgi:Na+/melibiose symporter-like transporter